MIITAYHGTSFEIEFFDLTHLDSNQDQSVFAGIYFTTDLNRAKDFAELSSQKTGNLPRVYVAELEIEHPLYANKGRKFFVTRSAFLHFIQEYFPDWFENNELKSVKKDYVDEKFSTYRGQFSMMQYASYESGVPLVEIEEELGYDSVIDGVNIAITNPNSILSFEEVDLSEQSATETIKDRYLIDSRHAQDYKTMPGNRYKRRLRIRTLGGDRVWYDIDANLFFNKDEFIFHIPVIGETDEYVVEIEIDNWLPILRSDIQSSGFSVNTFKNSLLKAFRTLNIKLHCDCADFKYRFAYWFSLKNDNSGAPETRPANKTNPQDKLGRGCKHILFCLQNSIWVTRIARIFFNYCFNLYKTNKSLFDRTIAKKLNITDEMVENRPLERRKPKQLASLPEEPEQEDRAQAQPMESKEIAEAAKVLPKDSSTETFAGEAYYSNYYKNATKFDDDQQYMIDLAKDDKIDVMLYVTPQNSPEQIWEVANDIRGHVTPDKIKILSDPDLSLQEHQILREAYLKRVDLFPYLGQSPDILKQLFLGIKQGINPDDLLIHGKNYRQLEQLRNIYKLDKDLFDRVKKLNLNYEQLKALIKRYKEEQTNGL